MLQRKVPGWTARRDGIECGDVFLHALNSARTEAHDLILDVKTDRSLFAYARAHRQQLARLEQLIHVGKIIVTMA